MKLDVEDITEWRDCGFVDMREIAGWMDRGVIELMDYEPTYAFASAPNSYDYDDSRMKE